MTATRPTSIEDLQAQPRRRASNYAAACAAMGSLQEFDHSTMHARWHSTRDGGPVYTVYSYETAVAWVEREETSARPNGEVGGMTTSKHLGYARRSLPEGGWSSLTV